jgi:hypothetical protein
MELDVSGHALTAMEEREIRRDWLAHAVESPELIREHADGTVHYFATIHEHDDRVLRVIVNPSTVPPKVVTVFFDRRMKGRLR